MNKKYVLETDQLEFHIFDHYAQLLNWLDEHQFIGSFTIDRRPEDELEANGFKLGDWVFEVVSMWGRYGPYVITKVYPDDGDPAFQLKYSYTGKVHTEKHIFLRHVEDDDYHVF